MNASALRQPNRLIYPPTLRLLPLWTLGTIRSAAFRWGRVGEKASGRMGEGVGTGQHCVHTNPCCACCRSGPWPQF